MTKAIMVMFDSLNRHMLPPYGCDWVHAPNFQRLAERTVTFDNSYVGSMPCMPAPPRAAHRALQLPAPQLGAAGAVRRLHARDPEARTASTPTWSATTTTTGRRAARTYHTRYNIVGDRARAGGRSLEGRRRRSRHPRTTSASAAAQCWRQDWVNRSYMQSEEDQPQAKTFAKGLEFIAHQPRRGQLVPAHRDLRPARALLHPAALQGPLPARLRRPALRLARLPRGRRRRRSRSSTCATRTPR